MHGYSGCRQIFGDVVEPIRDVVRRTSIPRGIPSFRSSPGRWLWLTIALGLCLVPGSTVRAEPALHFVTSDAKAKVLQLSDLRAACLPRAVEVDDPYHDRAMRYFAMSLQCVLELGFDDAGGVAGLRAKGFLLRALDGYTRPASGHDLLEPGGYVAYGEVELMSGPEAPPRFSPIERRKLDPAPFYLVWSLSGQNDPHDHPWPFQLNTIEIASFSEAFPRTLPSGLDAEDPGWSGYALFQQFCASCHSINGEGGKIGPDLNVPRSIVEYRPIPQIKAYIRYPEATRYTNMPGHPELGDAELDALIAYFDAMSRRKQDPRAESGS